MRIVRNNIKINMGLEELLEVLESELIDDILETMIELDESGVQAEFKIILEDVEMDDDDDDLTGISFLDAKGNELDFDGIKEELTSMYSMNNPWIRTETDKQVKRLLRLFDLENMNSVDDYI